MEHEIDFSDYFKRSGYKPLLSTIKARILLSQLKLNKFDFDYEECEYSILPVMSELSTVRCDRALGLWIAGTRASSVDGELLWRRCGRWTVQWTAVKGSRDRSSDRAAAVASTPGSRAQATTEGGFLGLRHKTKEADGG